MLKKLTLLAALMCLTLTLTACTNQPNQEYYETAQLYLGCGDYEYAAELFSQLGEFEDSADYTLYCRALKAMEDKDFDLARANLDAINPFKSSGRYLMLLDALAAEEAGEAEKALSLYEKLGTFADAHKEADRLRKAIPEAALNEGRALMAKKEYAAARDIFLSLDGYSISATLADNCTVALNKEAYSAADKLCEAGDHLGAMKAFASLGDTLDAAERAAACLASIHSELDKQYAAVTLATAPSLLEAYANLGDEETALRRIAELTARFGKNLAVLTGLDSMPCVQLGKYPAAESGEEHPVLWQVLKAEGSVITLLCTQVLDASAEAQSIMLQLNDAEKAAVGDVSLPAMSDLALLPDLKCSATPYALAQGAVSAGNAACYWLRDSLENGLHPVIGTSGVLSLPTEAMIPGIRPMLTLSLDQIVFNAGSGTESDPYRAD